MAHAIHRRFIARAAAAILAGGLLGGFLGLASAQDKTSGWLDEVCAKTCMVRCEPLHEHLADVEIT